MDWSFSQQASIRLALRAWRHRSTRSCQVAVEGDGGEARETLGPTSAGDDDDALTSGRPNLALRVDRP